MSKAEAYRHYSKGNDLRARKRDREALVEYQHALKLYPDLTPAKKEMEEVLLGQEKKQLQLADVFQQEGKLDKAIEAIAELLSFYPASWKAHKYLAQIYLAQNNLEGACHELKAAIDIAPQLCGLHFSMAKLYDLMENFDAALVEYEKALAQNPTDALILKQKKYTEELRTLYMRKDSSNDFAELIKISNVYIEKDYPEKAVDILQSALLSFPKHQEILYALANTYYKLKQFESATKYYLAAANEAPGSIKMDELFYNLGLSFSALSQYDKALEAMNSCIQENPTGKAAAKADEAIPILESQKKTP